VISIGELTTCLVEKKKDDLESVDWRKFYEGVKEFLENE
jgi:hypothetical protein